MGGFEDVGIIIEVSPPSLPLCSERFRNAISKDIGKARPRLSARRSIPAAAFGLKKYFGWTWGSKMSDNVDTAASLGHSEILAIKHSPRQAIPAFGKRFEDDPHVLTLLRRQETKNILDKEPSGFEKCDHTGELEEESTAFPCESSPLASDREILAGEAAADEINTQG
jgi:hypothetical protein